MEDFSNPWSDSPFKLAKDIKASSVFTPNKIKSDKTLSPVKLRKSAISPCKRGRPSKPLPRLSQISVMKFNKFIRTKKLQNELRESLLSDCASVDSFMHQSQEQFYKYPHFANSEIENNLIVTHRFFGAGVYKNTRNGQQMRESIQNSQSQSKILPSQ